MRAGSAAENFQINAPRFGESVHSRASSRQTHGTQAALALLFDARIMQSVAHKEIPDQKESLCARPRRIWALRWLAWDLPLLRQINPFQLQIDTDALRRLTAGQMLSGGQF